MTAFKDGRYPLELNGKTYHLLFSLNALEEIQEKVGDIGNLEKIFSDKDSIKNVKWLFTLLINEGRADDEPELTEREVGRIIHAGNLNNIKDSILSAFTYGTLGTDEPEPTESTEDEEGNGQGATH